MYSSNKPSLFSIIFKYIFIGSAILFIICMMCVVLHFMGVPIFSFVAGDPGIISIPVPITQQSAFIKAPITSDLSCNFLPVPSTHYTISFDTFIKGDFVTTTVPRVLLYRSAYPLALQTTDTMDTLPTLFSNSNIIVYIDPLKNDLFVSALKADSTYITTEPIKNVPLRVPFRITIIVSKNFLEVYLNGDLQQMIPFNGSIISSPATTYFFGPPPIVNGSIQVGNIQIWNDELSSKIVNMYGKQPISKTLFNQ